MLEISKRIALSNMLLQNFYTIIANDSFDLSSFVTTVEIHQEHAIFKGHFPNFPVTPGVGLLQIIKELTENHLHYPLFMESASRVKFLALVDPYKNPRLKFDITMSEELNKIEVKNTTSFIDGTVVLKCNVNFVKR